MDTAPRSNETNLKRARELAFLGVWDDLAFSQYNARLSAVRQSDDAEAMRDLKLCAKGESFLFDRCFRACIRVLREQLQGESFMEGRSANDQRMFLMNTPEAALIDQLLQDYFVTRLQAVNKEVDSDRIEGLTLRIQRTGAPVAQKRLVNSLEWSFQHLRAFHKRASGLSAEDFEWCLQKRYEAIDSLLQFYRELMKLVDARPDTFATALRASVAKCRGSLKRILLGDLVMRVSDVYGFSHEEAFTYVKANKIQEPHGVLELSGDLEGEVRMVQFRKHFYKALCEYMADLDKALIRFFGALQPSEPVSQQVADASAAVDEVFGDEPSTDEVHGEDDIELPNPDTDELVSPSSVDSSAVVSEALGGEGSRPFDMDEDSDSAEMGITIDFTNKGTLRPVGSTECEVEAPKRSRWPLGLLLGGAALGLGVMKTSFSEEAVSEPVTKLALVPAPEPNLGRWQVMEVEFVPSTENPSPERTERILGDANLAVELYCGDEAAKQDAILRGYQRVEGKVVPLELTIEGWDDQSLASNVYVHVSPKEACTLQEGTKETFVWR